MMIKPKLLKNYGNVRLCPSCGWIQHGYKGSGHTIHCQGCHTWFMVTYYLESYE